MKISILLPYKENFSPTYAGAVSILVIPILFEVSMILFASSNETFPEELDMP